MKIDLHKKEDLKEFSKTLKFLYIEDNQDIKEVTTATLKEFTENIVTANNGLEGLEKYHQDTFDLIITDISMPKMNGIEMVAKIREENSDIPILVVSAYSESKYFIDTIHLGVEGYLLKPIKLEQFFSIIFKTIEKIKMKATLEKYHQYLEQSNISLNENLKEKNTLLKELIYKDHLTALPNRFALEKKIAKNENRFIVIYLIDINNFRKLNEMYGFEKGNEILLAVSKKIQQTVIDKGLELYKTSADEFAIVQFLDEYNLQEIDKILALILNKIENQQISIEEDEIIINTTLGIAIDQKSVLTKASSALDLAKLENKKYLLYNDDEKFQGELEKLFYWQKEIKEALDNDSIIPFFQPIYNQNKELVKYEVLMRMKKTENNEIKFISPFFFLDISVKTKQYDKLSERVIEKALFVAKQNKDKCFSINLGFRDMSNTKVKDMLRQYVRESLQNNTPCNLVFEIVESEDISDYNTIKNFFSDFKCQELKIAIDDFGSGYSNFSHILELMPEYIKIDGSLIKDIDKNENMFTLTQAIISFAKKLGIKIIAEFVHSSEIFEILKAEDVDEFQGFYLAEPSPELKDK